MKQQPFYIGQEVICIENGPRSGVKEGDKYTIEGLLQCPGCGVWMVDVGKRSFGPIFCDKTSETFGNTDIFWLAARKFAPTETSRIKYTIKEVEVATQIREMEVQLS